MTVDVDAVMKRMVVKAEAELAARDARIAELRKRIAELEKEPDPGQAPFRGTSVAGASPDVERPSFLRAAQQRSEEDEVAVLKRMAERNADPDMRERATKALARRGVEL